jgi:nucleoside phosphorylase
MIGTEVNPPPAPDATAGQVEAPIGVVAAFSWEVRPLLQRQSEMRQSRTEKNGPVYSFIARGIPVHLSVAGMGAENAYREARRLVERFRVRGLVTIGFAGGLVDSLAVGDIVLPDHVQDQRTGERFDCNGGIWPVETGRRGGLLSATEVITSAAEKRSLAGKWGAVAVDMESAGVARAAAECGVAFSAIKSISDTSVKSISFDFARCRRDDNGLSFWKIIREGMRTPSTIRDLWLLARDARVAARALADALGSPELRGTR